MRRSTDPVARGAQGETTGIQVMSDAELRGAVQRITEGTLEQLAELAGKMEAGGASRVELNALNDQFHETVTRAAGNPVLHSFHAQTKMNYWNLSVPVVFTSDHDARNHRQHRDLIEALRQGDGEAAERIAREHVQLTIDVVLSSLVAPSTVM